jgi:hypothetical protein
MVIDDCPVKRATTSVPDKPLCCLNAFDRAARGQWLGFRCELTARPHEVDRFFVRR